MNPGPGIYIISLSQSALCFQPLTCDIGHVYNQPWQHRHHRNRNRHAWTVFWQLVVTSWLCITVDLWMECTWYWNKGHSHWRLMGYLCEKSQCTPILCPMGYLLCVFWRKLTILWKESLVSLWMSAKSHDSSAWLSPIYFLSRSTCSPVLC